MQRVGHGRFFFVVFVYCKYCSAKLLTDLHRRTCLHIPHTPFILK